MAMLSDLVSRLARRTCTQCKTSWAYKRILREYTGRVRRVRPFQEAFNHIRGRPYIDHYRCLACGHITEQKGWTLYEKAYQLIIADEYP